MDDTTSTTDVTNTDTTDVTTTDVSTTSDNNTDTSVVDGGSVTDGATDTDGGADTNVNDSSQAASVDGYADFQLPEGVSVDTARLEKAAGVFKDLGLSQEQAQSLVDFEAANVEAASTAQVEAFNNMVDEWATASKNDSEFGGDKFEESVSVAQSAINAFGTPELKELMDTHGIGNHPEVIRFMVRVGRLTQEDNPGSTGVATTEEKDRISILYGS